MYWFIRGAQSALFYYASCTPCIDKARKRKIRQDNRREREFREYIQQHHAGDYHMQPEPFATNPHWEADFGCPTTPRPGRSQKKTKTRANSNTSKQPRSSEVSELPRSIQPSPSLRPQRSAADSAVPPASGWDRQQNQRQDDEVWGFEYTDGTFHTGPARPISRTNTNTNPYLQAPSLDDRASPLLSPSSASRPQTGGSSRTGQGPYNSPPFFADINEMVPPSVALPDEYQNGNAWFRQPPPDRGVMRNSQSTSPALSARSRPSTRSRDPELRREISSRMLERQQSKTELLALPGPALSRSSTVERRARRRAPTLERSEEAIPDILDDDYVPSSANSTLSVVKKPGTSQSARSFRPASSTRRQQQSSQSLISSSPLGSGSSETVIHPRISSEDAAADADVEEIESEDEDSGVEFDSSPSKPAAVHRSAGNVKVGPVTAVADRKGRVKPFRTLTAPDASVLTSSTPRQLSQRRKDSIAAVRGKKYIVTSQEVTPHLRTTATNMKQQSPNVQADLDLYHEALAAGQAPQDEIVNVLALHEQASNDTDGADPHWEDDGDGDESEDPRWRWTRSRRWSADV